jgi:uracil-DNA glycosylase family 4
LCLRVFVRVLFPGFPRHFAPADIAPAKAALELDLVNPRLILALGATAARGLTGQAVRISRHRGEILPGPAGRALLLTVHPSCLLRIPDEQGRQVDYAKFVRDLQLAAANVSQ